MKRVKIWLVTLLTFLVSAFTFTSCEALAGIFGDSIVGTYKTCGIMKMGVTYEIGDEVVGVVLTENTVELEIKSDNTFVLKFNNLKTSYYEEALTEEYVGTWEKDEEYAGELYYMLIMEDNSGGFWIRINEKENFFGLQVGEGTYVMLEKQAFLPF